MLSVKVPRQKQQDEIEQLPGEGTAALVQSGVIGSSRRPIWLSCSAGRDLVLCYSDSHSIAICWSDTIHKSRRVMIEHLFDAPVRVATV